MEKTNFFSGMTITGWLIMINVWCFLTVVLFGSFLGISISDSGLQSQAFLNGRFWTLFTYMFMHGNFWHLFFISFLDKPLEAANKKSWHRNANFSYCRGGLVNKECLSKNVAPIAPSVNCVD